MIAILIGINVYLVHTILFGGDKLIRAKNHIPTKVTINTCQKGMRLPESTNGLQSKPIIKTGTRDNALSEVLYKQKPVLDIIYSDTTLTIIITTVET